MKINLSAANDLLLLYLFYLPAHFAMCLYNICHRFEEPLEINLKNRPVKKLEPARAGKWIAAHSYEEHDF